MKETNFEEEKSLQCEIPPLPAGSPKGQGTSWKADTLCHLPGLTAASYPAVEGDLPPADVSALLVLLLEWNFRVKRGAGYLW